MLHFLPLLFLLILITPIDSRADPVRVHLRWEYDKLPLRMEVYEPKPRPRQHVWKMHSVNEWSRVPVTTRLADDSFALEAGAAKRVVLVMRNDTDHAVRFTAAPHQIHPPGGGGKPRFRFRCLCVHQTYEIAPHHIWYRVVELRTAREVKDPEITLTHLVVGE